MSTSHDFSRSNLGPVVRLIAVLGAILLASPAHAGVNVWTGSGPRAKSFESVARDPKNPARLWAAAFGAGVYRSLDGGVTWTSYRTGLVNTFVRCLAVNPKHPDSLWAGTNDGAYLSGDGGVTWKLMLSTAKSVRGITIHPIRTGTVYAATFGLGIYKTVNNGTNWNTLNNGLVNTDVRDLTLQPDKPDTIWACTGTGGGLHQTFNGGASWSHLSDNTVNAGAAAMLRYDPTDASFKTLYLAMVDRGVAKSTNGGGSWATVNKGLTSFRCTGLAVVGNARYVTTDNAGAFYTTATDTMWHDISAGVPSLVTNDIMASSFGPDTAWVCTDGSGLYRTVNHGATWSAIDGGSLQTFGFALTLDPVSHVVYDGCGFGDQFWRSTNQGATWIRANYLFSHSSEKEIVIDPLNSNRLYLTSFASGIYRSDDGGITWSRPDSLTASLTNDFVRPLVAIPGQTGHLFTGSESGVFESVNAAGTFTPRSVGLPAGLIVRSMVYVTGATNWMFAGTESLGVYRSSDLGATWSADSAGMGKMQVHDLIADATNHAIVYAATDSGVYKSVNSGASWVRSSTGLPGGIAVRAIAQDLVHTGLLFAGTFGGGVYKSVDAGAHWTSFVNQSGLSTLNVYALAVDGALTTIYAGTDQGVQVLNGYSTATTGVAPGTATLALMLSAGPNPLRGASAQLHFVLPQAAAAQLDVYGIDGARVRRLGAQTFAAGEHTLAWDAHDDAGALVAPGLYFIRLSSGAQTRTVRLAVLGGR
jgi:hypothetical protein